MKKLFLILLSFFMQCSLIGMELAPQSPIRPQTPPQVFEPEDDLENIYDEALELLKQNNEFDPSDVVQEYQYDDLYIQNNETKGKAVAVFEYISNDDPIAITSDDAIEVRELLKVYDFKKNGNHYTVLFDYKDKNILPITKEQAIYLLLYPYSEKITPVNQCSNNDLIDYRTYLQSILNKDQQDAIFAKKYIDKSFDNQTHKRRKLNTDQHQSNQQTDLNNVEGHNPVQSAEYDESLELAAITNAEELFSTLGFDLNAVPEHHNYKHIIPELNRYITLLNNSATPQQKLLYGIVIVQLITRIEPKVFNGLNIQRFPDLGKRCNYYEPTWFMLMNVNRVFLAMEDSLEQIPDDVISKMQEIEILAVMLWEMANNNDSLSLKEQADFIKSCMLRIERMIEKASGRLPKAQLKNVKFGLLTQGQISTIMTNEYLRVAKKIFDPQYTSQVNKQVTQEIFNLDVISHFPATEAAFKDFFRFEFTSGSLNMLNDDGVIYDIKEYAQIHNKLLQDWKPKLEEGVPAHTYVMTHKGKVRIDLIQFGDQIQINRNGKKEFAKVTNVVKEHVSRMVFIVTKDKIIPLPFNEKIILHDGSAITTIELKNNIELAKELYPDLVSIHETENLNMEVVRLSLDADPHTYLLVDYDTLVHNNPGIPVLIIGGLTWSGGIINTVIEVIRYIGPPLIMIGTFIVSWLISKKSSKGNSYGSLERVNDTNNKKNIQQCGAALEKRNDPKGTCGTSQQKQEVPVPATCVPQKPLSDTQGICPQQANYQAPIPGHCLQKPAYPEQMACEVIDPSADAMHKEAADLEAQSQESTSKDQNIMQTRSKAKELNAKNNDIKQNNQLNNKDIPEFIRENKVPKDKDTVLKSPDFTRTKKDFKGATIYKHKDGTYWYRDTFHTGKSAHLEVFNKRGEHIGEADPLTGIITPGTADPKKSIRHLL